MRLGEVPRLCAMAHVAPNARPRMAGLVVPALVMLRHGRLRSHLAQRTSESKEAMRLRTAGSRMAERPAMDGRAGLSGAGDVTPWTAAALPAASARRAMAHVAPNARPGMAGPVVPALVMPRHGRLRSHLAQRTSESKEAMRLRTAGSRMAERPAMDGRAGLSGAGDATPWTAAALPAASAGRAVAHVAPNARPRPGLGRLPRSVTPRGRGREPSAAAPVPLPAAPRAPAAAVRARGADPPPPGVTACVTRRCTAGRRRLPSSPCSAT
ncbi:hypothetical protein NB709_003265 [Xanthomonas sacchari]|nr:hypothetical protein [Xanthomonas sacchari]